MKNAFHGIASRFHTNQKRIHKPEDRSIDTFQTERQKKNKEINKRNGKSKSCETVKRCNIYAVGLSDKERAEKKKE